MNGKVTSSAATTQNSQEIDGMRVNQKSDMSLIDRFVRLLTGRSESTCQNRKTPQQITITVKTLWRGRGRLNRLKVMSGGRPKYAKPIIDQRAITTTRSSF